MVLFSKASKGAGFREAVWKGQKGFMPEAINNDNRSEIVLYKTEDGQARLDVIFRDETVWLTQDQMSDLFEKAKSTINEHIRNIYQEKELFENETMRKFGNSEFMAKPTNFYNLDVIISVGYRVKSPRGTQFRKHKFPRVGRA